MMTTLSEHLARLGRKGGTATARNRTKEQRSEAARKAVQARWAKLEKTVAQLDTDSKALLKKVEARKRAKQKKERAS
jgi:general stress protein YciG